MVHYSCSSGSSDKPSSEVQALVDSCKAWQRKDKDTAIKYAEEARKLSESIGDQAGQDRAAVLPLMIYANRWEEPLVAESLAKALIIEGQALGREYRVSRAKSVLGAIEQNKENYVEAILLQEEALEMERTANRGESIMGDLINLGTTYGYFGNYTKEIECYYEALKICDSLGLNRFRPRLIANLAATNFDLGNLDVSERFLLESIALKGKAGKSATADDYRNLAVIYRERDEFDAASEYLETSDSIAAINKDRGQLYRNRLTEVNLLIGRGRNQAALDSISRLDEWEVGGLDSMSYYYKLQLRAFGYFEIGKFDSAEKYVRLHEAYCRSVGGPREMLANYETNANFYQKAGNYEKALEYFFLADKLGDSLANYQASQNAILEQGKYDRLKAEKKIVEAEKETQRSKAVGIGVGLVFLSISGFFFVRNRGQRKLGRIKDEQIAKAKARITSLNEALEDKQVVLDQKAIEIRKLLDQMEAIRESGEDASVINDLERRVVEEQRVQAELLKDLDILEDAIIDLEGDLPSSFSDLAYPDAGIRFRDIICARSKGHEFLMIYLDSEGRTKDTTITRSRTIKGPDRIYKLIQASNGILLTPYKGFAVNPVFAELSADGKHLEIKHEESLKIIRTNMASKNPLFRFFDEETIPIASGRAMKNRKDFDLEYNEWKRRHRRLIA